MIIGLKRNNHPQAQKTSKRKQTANEQATSKPSESKQ
jgi:hypothetical protein